MRISVAVLSFLLALSPVATVGQSNERLPIIDMHLHAFPVNPANTNEPFWLPGGLHRARTQAELLRRTLDELERYNVVKAMASGPLDVVQAWKAEAPDRIIASISFSRGQCRSSGRSPRGVSKRTTGSSRRGDGTTRRAESERSFL